MERWNELIAGYVLGNLTAEEQRELAQALAVNPRLTDEIERLRMTATIRGITAVGRSLTTLEGRLEDGSEGWADTALGLPAELSALPMGDLPRSSLSAAASDSAQAPYFSDSLAFWSRSRAVAPASRFWPCVLLIALAAVCMDNFRVRRSLSIAREKIIQLETQLAPSVGP
jgi:anti-sigma factor RsiW